MKERDYGFDNSKLILIILVVFAHLLEISTKNYGAKCDIYRVIYSFHMPAFVFLTGYFLSIISAMQISSKSYLLH